MKKKAQTGVRSAFGLTSDTRRAVRLLFQPTLVVWALWSTGQTGSTDM